MEGVGHTPQVRAACVHQDPRVSGSRSDPSVNSFLGRKLWLSGSKDPLLLPGRTSGLRQGQGGERASWTSHCEKALSLGVSRQVALECLPLGPDWQENCLTYFQIHPPTYGPHNRVIEQKWRHNPQIHHNTFTKLCQI